ncbi:PREDICTED: uncharacterized protein LOC103085140 [Lipotes vexillifer]|uniref:Uncharacterized protein LOC103085140 n=1 Tax=Lipotes vexillifer TaxID=118797 RepID=A0A340YIP9_LIPVE|nr:PREDICTED: uncharacterized protein LOC103085140 [Lipotes vexillifer]
MSAYPAAIGGAEGPAEPAQGKAIQVIALRTQGHVKAKKEKLKLVGSNLWPLGHSPAGDEVIKLMAKSKLAQHHVHLLFLPGGRGGEEERRGKASSPLLNDVIQRLSMSFHWPELGHTKLQQNPRMALSSMFQINTSGGSVILSNRLVRLTVHWIGQPVPSLPKSPSKRLQPASVVALPRSLAPAFENFYQVNSGPLPLLGQSEPGKWTLPALDAVPGTRKSSPGQMALPSVHFITQARNLTPQG